MPAQFDALLENPNGSTPIPCTVEYKALYQLVKELFDHKDESPERYREWEIAELKRIRMYLSGEHVKK